MATYTYNGKVLIKNSRRENYKYACINKNTFDKVQISSTREGASVELNNWIASSEQYIENCGRALKAIEEGKTGFLSLSPFYSQYNQYFFFLCLILFSHVIQQIDLGKQILILLLFPDIFFSFLF